MEQTDIEQQIAAAEKADRVKDALWLEGQARMVTEAMQGARQGGAPEQVRGGPELVDVLSARYYLEQVATTVERLAGDLEDAARAMGATWGQIATAAACTKQAAQQRTERRNAARF